MQTNNKYGVIVSWTCYECFGEVLDHDNDGVGWCTGCRRVVDANGVPQKRFAALRDTLERMQDRPVYFELSLVSDPLPGQTFEVTDLRKETR